VGREVLVDDAAVLDGRVVGVVEVRPPVEGSTPARIARPTIAARKDAAARLSSWQFGFGPRRSAWTAFSMASKSATV